MYLLIKSIHIISFISWMAALLYLPRLYVYHSKSPIESIQSETFKIMERKLIKIIMNPAMIVTFITGVSLFLYNQPLIYNTSLQIKVFLVLALAYVHGKFIKFYKLLEQDDRDKTEFHYRVWNEVPTCLMILIVLLVVIKPF